MKEAPIEKGVIRELVIEDVDPSDTDEQLWEWAINTVLLPSAIEVGPWTRNSLRRNPEARTATISLYIEVERGVEGRPPRSS